MPLKPRLDVMPRVICVAKDRYPPFRVDIVELMSRRLGAAGLCCDWIMQRDQPGRSEIIEHSASERFLVLDRGFGIVSGAMLLARAVMAILRGDYQIVQVRDLPLTAVLFLLLARLARRPFVYWMSFPMVESPGHRARNPDERIPAWRRVVMRLYSAVGGFFYYRVVMRGADQIIVQSDRMKADLVRRGIKPGKIVPVPMGVSTEIYHPAAVAPADDPNSSGAAVLVYVGTCLPVRRIDIMVRALADLVRRGRDAMLVIVGDVRPEDATRLRAVAAEEHVADRLVFTGRLPLVQALGYVRRATVCLAPCPKDPILLPGTPTKLVEYLAMGRPVVANDHPDQMHVLHASGAGLVAPLSPRGFADAIDQLLADPAAAEAMGERGPAWVAANRSYDVLSTRVFAAYTSLLRGWDRRYGKTAQASDRRP